MKKISIATTIVLVFMTVGYMTTKKTNANPLFFPITVQTSSSTTTPAYMTAGTATTTLTMDTYLSGVPTPVLHSTLLIQFSATSSTPTLNTNIQYSQDGVDWYQEAGTFVDGYATTTKPFDISAVNQYKLNFASTTQSLGVIGSTSATSTRALSIPTPTRFVRAIFSLPVGSGSGGVWAQFVPLKESK